MTQTELENRPVAVVTGASRGLGRALADALVDRGWRVVVDGRDPARLREAVAGWGDRATSVPGDVADSAHRGELAAAAAAAGGASLLVNNASELGPSPLPRLADHPLDALAQVLAVDVLAPVGLFQLLLPQLLRNGGRVLNLSSDAAVQPYAGWGGYGAAKAALDHASAVLAVEHPELRVFAVDPGDLRTEMHQRAFPGEDISDRPLPESVVPALLHLVHGDLPSGRYLAADLQVAS